MLCSHIACSKTAEAAPTEVYVQAEHPEKGEISEQITADATLAPLAQAAISPKVTAPVKKFYVQRGSHVKAGQLLATLETSDLEAAALDNKGAYSAAQGTYDIATGATVPEDTVKAELDLTQATANLNLAQSIVDSRTQLFSEGAIPGRDLDTAKAALVQAKAAHEIAKQHLEAVQKISHKAALESAQGQLTSAKGKYLGAQAQLSYTEIRSPISGVVTDRPLFAGETAAAGTPVITVMDTSALLAKLHLSQTQAQQLSLGAAATITVPGVADPVPAKVSLISPALDPGSTTVEVWLRMENPKGTLKAGTPVHTTITGRTAANALLVPQEAVQTAPDGVSKSVLVINADGTRRQTCRDPRHPQTPSRSQILSGLSPGDTVITTGAYGLDAGTKVRSAPLPRKPEETRTDGRLAARRRRETHSGSQTAAKPIFFFLALLTLAGIYMAFQVPISVFPETNFPRVVIGVDNGVMPVEQMQVTITKPIEDAVNSVPGLLTVRSTTSRGSAEVSLFFDWNVDMFRTLQLTDAALSKVSQSLPATARITTNRLTFATFPILGYALTADDRGKDTVSQTRLWEIATYDLKPPLNRVNGVSTVTVQGGQVPEFHIVPNLSRLQAAGVTLLELVNAVQESNIIDSPGLYEANHQLILGADWSPGAQRCRAKQPDCEDLARRSGHPRRRYRPQSNPLPCRFIPRSRSNGKPAVLLNITRQPSGNTVAVANGVAAEMAQLQSKLPAGVHIRLFTTSRSWCARAFSASATLFSSAWCSPVSSCSSFSTTGLLRWSPAWSSLSPSR